MRFTAVLIALVAGVACHTAAPPPVTQPAVPQTPAPQDPAATRPSVVRPGAPGDASTVGAAPSVPVNIRHVRADVAFMQGMIGHHAQALEMVNLLETRTDNSGMKLLALRIKVSQQDEITFMQRWLETRGETVPGAHAHHAHDFTLMPGMLTPDEMATLAAAKGAAFDRLFLEYMIKHHDGAIVMVNELFKTDGAGQESEIYAFASDVIADQQMEIDRMIGMLRGMGT
ncbi:MAG: DUF305 domain-containing protein [Vicinamibacterales bacterium]